jgi:membrane protease YdiL (CAAX protease family)
MRYLYICLFLVFLPIPLALLEGLYRVTGSGLSIFDTRGFGQVSMLFTVILMVFGYVTLIAKDSVRDFFMLYLRNWRTALRGFLVMLAIAWAIVIAAYVLMGLLGYVHWSMDAWNEMTWRVARRTGVALLVVLVLAITEELMFRVFLMRYLRWNTSKAVTIGAVVFSSLVFASVHNLTDPLAWLQPEEAMLFVGLFLLGVLLCITYLATGSFWCAVAVHSGLLGSKVFLRRTEVLDVSTGSWWLNTPDLRATPLTWALFVGLAIGIYLLRKPLTACFSIERPVVSTAKFPPAG